MENTHRETPMKLGRERHRQPTSLIDAYFMRFALRLFLLLSLGQAVPGDTSVDNRQHADLSDESPNSEKVGTRYEYQMDGFKIMSNSVPESDFLKYYARAKALIGGIYWEPSVLRIEYGSLNRGSSVAGVGSIGRTSSGCTNIVAGKGQMTHELIHFLIGPKAQKNWPLVLREFVASVANIADPNQVPQEALDASWIQMGHAGSMATHSIVTSLRYDALAGLAKKHADKIPEIVKALFDCEKMETSDVKEFLEDFSIRHHLFELGESGDQTALLPYTHMRQDMFIFIWYGRVKGTPDENIVVGKFGAIFTDKYGTKYQTGILTLNGAGLVPLPEGLKREDVKTVHILRSKMPQLEFKL